MNFWWHYNSKKICNPKTQGSNYPFSVLKFNIFNIFIYWIFPGWSSQEQKYSGVCRKYIYICIKDRCVWLLYLIYPLYYDFPIKIISVQLFFMLLIISLKDEAKPNPAVNSSPSSWGKTWITMTQQSSTALSMEKTNSSVWRISGRPGKHLKVKKGKKSRNPFPRFWVSGGLGRQCSSQRDVLLFPFLGCGFPAFPRGSRMLLLHLSMASKASVFVLFLCPRGVC